MKKGGGGDFLPQGGGGTKIFQISYQKTYQCVSTGYQNMK